MLDKRCARQLGANFLSFKSDAAENNRLIKSISFKIRAASDFVRLNLIRGSIYINHWSPGAAGLF